VFLADHPSTYRMAGLRWGTATSSSTRPGTTSGGVQGGVPRDPHNTAQLLNCLKSNPQR
jgi:hypothetical protein